MQKSTIIHYASPQHQGAYAGIVLPELGPTRSANASGSPGDFSCAKFRGRLGVTGLIELRIRVGSQFWQFVNHPVLRVLSPTHSARERIAAILIDRDDQSRLIVFKDISTAPREGGSPSLGAQNILERSRIFPATSLGNSFAK